MDQNIYIEHGYKSRAHYLQQLAEDYGVDYNTVVATAGILGPEEDFDALVTWIEDASDEAPDEELVDLPDTIPFPKNTHLMHPHSGKEVVVERDNGGATVYVAFLGTGRTQSIPRGALVPMKAPEVKSSTKAAAEDIPKKVKATPNDYPFKQETRDFMQEVTPENYQGIMKVLFDEDVKYKHDPKIWGRIKMQMGNRVRGLLTKKIMTDAQLWQVLSAECALDRKGHSDRREEPSFHGDGV